MTISPSDTITRSGKIAQRLFEECMLVITAADSMLHRFNEVGTFIWRLIEKPMTVGEICADVKNAFDGVDERAFSDIRAFILEMEKKELITVSRIRKE